MSEPRTKLRGSDTRQDQVENARTPLVDGLLAVLCNIILNFLLPHERGQNRLVNGVIWGTLSVNTARN